MSSEFEKLFEPIKIGPMEVKNRIAVAPMGTIACTNEGYVTDQILAHNTARAKGGAGLIIVEHTFATDRYGGPMRVLGLWDERQMSGMGELSEAIHTFGTKAIIQLSLGLGAAGILQWSKGGLVAPSPIPLTVREDSFPNSFPKALRALRAGGRAVPRALTVDEIIELEDLFVEAARRAKTAGFDGLEIHGAHGCLIAQFLSPISNARTDLYGGSLENRLRLPLNLIRKTRAVLGRDWVIGYRISADEHIEGGLTLEDSKVMVPVLVGAGLDYLHLSSGRSAEASKWTFPDKEGVILPEAAEIKGVVSVPVICPNLYTPRLAEEALREGKADIVSLGRQLFADPDWPNKVKEGKIDQILKCNRCNLCLRRIFVGLVPKCPVNPNLSLERFIAEYYPVKSKLVSVQ